MLPTDCPIHRDAGMMSRESVVSIVNYCGCTGPKKEG